MAKRINNPGIYAIFNLVNGKVYIGQATDLGARYIEHWANNGVNDNHNKDISADFAVLGVDSFIFIILEFVEFPIDFEKGLETNKKYLKSYEDKWIDYYECLNPLYGYNKVYGGVTTLGADFYNDPRRSEKIRQAHIAYYLQHDYPMKGKKHTKESNEKNRQAQLKRFKDNPVSEETKRKLRENHPDRHGENHPMWGTHHSMESNEKNRQSQFKRYTDNPVTLESKAIMSKAQFKRFKDNPHNEATKQKIRDNTPRRYGKDNPNYGKIVCRKDFYYVSPENRYYFLINIYHFAVNFNLDPNSLSKLARKINKSHKGWSGGYAPQWMVNKVKPLLKEGQLWIEIDQDGNIIKDDKEL